MLPGGVAPERAPLIAWVHGGPITRAYDTYDPQLQLLVNRGAAVFVPNFRASTGYGRRYVLAANGDVGDGRVLADILEGLDFLLAEGIGDRARQGVMGMSFGGYASLLAVSHRPTRFRVAFAGIPPTEYGWTKAWQVEHDPDPTNADGPPLGVQFERRGFRYRDSAWRERMRRESPLAMLAALRTPVYLWAGVRDDRVPLRSVTHYVGQARRLGKPVTLMIDPDAGHGPGGPASADALLYLMELALHRHLGAPAPAVTADVRPVFERQLRVDGASRAAAASAAPASTPARSTTRSVKPNQWGMHRR
jgi:dipeptidyl aminopeptidase/acylaminoacyl peptidase